VKIRSVKINNRKKAFEVRTHSRVYSFPYAKAEPRPTGVDPITHAAVDEELGREGFVFVLESGREGTVHIEQVLEYDQDPGYLRDLLLYKLTLEAQKRVEGSELSKREIIRRLGTKSVDQVLRLLHVLECDVDLIVRTRNA
jgi:hypothetical protein